MSDDITLGEVHRLLLEIRSDVKAQNGKVAQHTTELAVLRVEQETLKEDARSSGRNWGAGAGAFVGGVIAVLSAVWGQK